MTGELLLFSGTWETQTWRGTTSSSSLKALSTDALEMRWLPEFVPELQAVSSLLLSSRANTFPSSCFHPFYQKHIKVVEANIPSLQLHAFCSNKSFYSLVCYLEENRPFRNNCPYHWQLSAAAREVGVRRGAVLCRCTVGYLAGQQIILFLLKTNKGTSINTINFLDRLVSWKYQASCSYRVTS